MTTKRRKKAEAQVIDIGEARRRLRAGRTVHSIAPRASVLLEDVPPLNRRQLYYKQRASRKGWQ